jgi:hypothetical protein
LANDSLLQLLNQMGTLVTVLIGHLGLIARPIVFYFFSDFFLRVKPLAIATECLQGTDHMSKSFWDIFIIIGRLLNGLDRRSICSSVVISG